MRLKVTGRGLDQETGRFVNSIFQNVGNSWFHMRFSSAESYTLQENSVVRASRGLAVVVPRGHVKGDDELAPSHSTANPGDHFTGPRVSKRRRSVRGAKSHFATRQTP